MEKGTKGVWSKILFVVSKFIYIYKYFTPSFHTGLLLKPDSVEIYQSANSSSCCASCVKLDERKKTQCNTGTKDQDMFCRVSRGEAQRPSPFVCSCSFWASSEPDVLQCTETQAEVLRCFAAILNCACWWSWLKVFEFFRPLQRRRKRI